MGLGARRATVGAMSSQDPPGQTGQRAADAGEKPEFGPSGYLPPKASARARKIVLRAPLGLQWVIGSLVVGVVVLVAGWLLLRASSAPLPEPWVAVGPAAEVGAAEWHDGLDVLLVGAGGRIRAFVGADDVAYCPESNRLEAEGRVWTLTGRGLGTDSLEEHPTFVQDDVLYVDPTRTVTAGDP